MLPHLLQNSRTTLCCFFQVNSYVRNKRYIVLSIFMITSVNNLRGSTCYRNRFFAFNMLYHLTFFLSFFVFSVQKVPPTRAKSPKLTRRKSCSDARERDGYCCRMHRNSLDSCHNETAKIAPSTPKTSIMTTTKAASKPVRQKPAGQTGTGTNITVHT